MNAYTDINSNTFLFLFLQVIHSTNLPFPCQYCTRSFVTAGKLARHLQAHAGKRAYPCKYCSKSYLLSHHLSRHLRMHKQAPAASFTCSVCKDTHRTYESLVDHSAIHAGISQVCPLCKASMEDFDSVERHMQAHKESERHACEFCDYIFLSSSQLQKHIEDDHVVDMVPYQNESDYTGDKSLPEEGDLLEELLGDEDSQSQSLTQSNESTSPPKAKIRKLNPATKPERKPVKQEPVSPEHIKKESGTTRGRSSAVSVSPEDRRQTRSKESKDRSLKSDSGKKIARKSTEADSPKQQGNRQRNGRVAKK